MLRQTYISGSTFSRRERQGVVLLIVLALRAPFASVALSFVFYAEAEATASNYVSQAQTAGSADIEPELLLSYFLGQVIYGTEDIYSVLRGHDLGRNMYGYNPAGRNDLPFNGTGRLRYARMHPITGAVVDNFNAINYQVYKTDGFQRKPEWYGFTTDPDHRYVGEQGTPWTYPDLQSVFLAAV